MPSLRDIVNNAPEAVSSEFFTPPEGDYKVHVVEARGKNNSRGVPMVSLWLQIEGGPHNEQRFWDHLAFEDGAQGLPINLGKMSAMGVDRQTIAAADDIAVVAGLVEGWSGEVKVKHKARKGRDITDDPFVNTTYKKTKLQVVEPVADDEDELDF